MPKKITGYVVFGFVVIAILILVYLFVTKGYLGKGITTLPSTQTPAPETSPQPNITSNKISLTVTSPKDGSTLDSTNAVVKGKTVPGADVFVNDQSAKADASGNFSISIGLDEGSNLIVVSANDAEGNVTEQNINVTVASF